MFLDEIGELGLVLSPEAMEALVKYHWPGNVRELRHVLKRAVLLNQGEVLDRGDLDFDAGRGGVPDVIGAPGFQPLEAQMSCL